MIYGPSNVKFNKKNSQIRVLHQNICSLRNKVTELEVWLNSELKQVDVICFTEHWLNHAMLNSTNISNFKLASAFCRKSSAHRGSCIYVKENIIIREIDYFTSLSEEKNFEISLINLVDYKLYVVCIYISLEGQIDYFLNKLESLIQKRTNKEISTFVWRLEHRPS